jgi:hypothetical protein
MTSGLWKRSYAKLSFRNVRLSISKAKFDFDLRFRQGSIWKQRKFCVINGLKFQNTFFCIPKDYNLCRL